MERIGLVGLSWRNGGADALARFTIPEPERAGRLPALARALGVAELAYLATCNRVELAFVVPPGEAIGPYRARVYRELTGRDPAPGEAERTLRAWAGEGAAEHLLLVAAGLDSARPGETEIAGQVRAAYDLARSLGLVGSRLELLFEHALRVAARVHRDTHVGERRVSLAEIAFDRIRERLARTPGAVAAIGVSPMTERACRELAADGAEIVVVNRTLSRAEALAREVGGRAVPLDRFREQPAAVEAVISATSSPDPVLDRAALERLAARAPSGEAPLVVDMAVPPDVDPEDAARVGIERVGMNQIIAIAEENRRDRLVELADARTIVDEALEELRHRIVERHLAPVLAALQRRYRATATEGVDRLLRKELRGLGEDEQRAVRRWAEMLARRFAHIPTAGLRALARHAGNEAVDRFLAGLDRDLADELSRAAEAASGAPAVVRDEEDLP
ncbi:MAG: glutamyl-tRNA reductase [Acidobacteriota bacterium]